MAKQPETRHRFRIIAETSAEAMGPLLAQLTIMGLENVNFELITDVAVWKQKVKHETTAEEAMLDYIKDNPTFQINAAVKHLEIAGRTKGAAYTAIKLLTEKGVLKKLSTGNYSSVAVKAIAAPEKTKSTVTPEYTGFESILRFAKRHGGKFTTQQIIALFDSEGRNKNSVYPSCDNLLKKKMIKRVGQPGSGEYRLLAKTKQMPVKKRRKQPPLAPRPNLNGAGVADHG